MNSTATTGKPAASSTDKVSDHHRLELDPNLIIRMISALIFLSACTLVLAITSLLRIGDSNDYWDATNDRLTASDNGQLANTERFDQIDSRLLLMEKFLYVRTRDRFTRKDFQSWRDELEELNLQQELKVPPVPDPDAALQSTEISEYSTE